VEGPIILIVNKADGDEEVYLYLVEYKNSLKYINIIKFDRIGR
jgi:hypothetical protein